MLLLLLTILITTSLIVLFKLFARWHVNLFQAITLNYFLCLILGSFLSGTIPFNKDILAEEWFPFTLILGFLFICGFQIAGLTVRYYGITLASVMQRMSLVLSAGFAIAIYHEPIGPWGMFGILLAIMSILLINYKARLYEPGLQASSSLIVLPFLTWLIGGCIESILYYLNIEGLSYASEMVLTTQAFGIAAILGLVGSLGYHIIGKHRFSISPKSIMAGLLLGLPNFFSIYCILLLLKSGFKGATLFPVLNIAVVLCSSLVGIFIFSERLRHVNYIGLGLAILSILLMALFM